MGFFNGGGRALPAVAYDAAKLIQLMGNDRMPAERLHAHICEAGFLQSHMASRTAIDHAEIWKPDLLNSALKMALQGNRIAAAPNQCSDIDFDNGATR